MSNPLTTKEVRDFYIYGGWECGDKEGARNDFDAWLAEVKAQAVRDFINENVKSLQFDYLGNRKPLN